MAGRRGSSFGGPSARRGQRSKPEPRCEVPMQPWLELAGRERWKLHGMKPSLECTARGSTGTGNGVVSGPARSRVGRQAKPLIAHGPAQATSDSKGCVQNKEHTRVCNRGSCQKATPWALHVTPQQGARKVPPPVLEVGIVGRVWVMGVDLSLMSPCHPPGTE